MIPSRSENENLQEKEKMFTKYLSDKVLIL